MPEAHSTNPALKSKSLKALNLEEPKSAQASITYAGQPESAQEVQTGTEQEYIYKALLDINKMYIDFNKDYYVTEVDYNITKTGGSKKNKMSGGGKINIYPYPKIENLDLDNLNHQVLCDEFIKQSYKKYIDNAFYTRYSAKEVLQSLFKLNPLPKYKKFLLEEIEGLLKSINSSFKNNNLGLGLEPLDINRLVTRNNNIVIKSRYSRHISQGGRLNQIYDFLKNYSFPNETIDSSKFLATFTKYCYNVNQWSYEIPIFLLNYVRTNTTETIKIEEINLINYNVFTIINNNLQYNSGASLHDNIKNQDNLLNIIYNKVSKLQIQQKFAECDNVEFDEYLRYIVQTILGKCIGENHNNTENLDFSIFNNSLKKNFYNDYKKIELIFFDCIPMLLTTPLVEYKFDYAKLDNITGDSLYQLFSSIKSVLIHSTKTTGLVIAQNKQAQTANVSQQPPPQQPNYDEDDEDDKDYEDEEIEYIQYLLGEIFPESRSRTKFTGTYNDPFDLLTQNQISKFKEIKGLKDIKLNYTNLFKILFKLKKYIVTKNKIKDNLNNIILITFIKDYNEDTYTTDYIKTRIDEIFPQTQAAGGRRLNRHLFSYKFACFFLNNSKMGINFQSDIGFANSPIPIKSIIPYLQVNLSKKDLLYLINHCDFSLDDVLTAKYVDYRDLEEHISKKKHLMKKTNRNKNMYFSKAIAKELIRIIENDYLTYTTGRKRTNEIAASMLWQYNNNIIPKTCIKWINMSDISTKMLQKCQYKDTGLNKKTKDSKDKKTKDSKKPKDSIKKGKKSITGNRIKR